MIIYWNRNTAGTHRGQNFFIKGQKFLQYYVSGRNIPPVVTTIDTFLFNSYIETTASFNSHIETTNTFKSEVK